jgi:hypothetical protein
MGLSNPRAIYGVHSVSPYNRTTGEFYGTAKVIGQFAANFSGELSALNGGSSPYPWAVEQGTFKAEMSLSFKEYADWMFELFLGQKPTTSGADAAGSVSTAANKKGTSVISATTGIASVVVIPSTGKANLKFGKYVVVATGTNKVDVRMSSDADFNRGTSGEFIDDLLTVAKDLTIATGTNDIAAFGLRLTGGSGTIGFTVGDTAVFEVKPPSSASMEVVVGASGATFPEFGCVAMAQKRGTGELCELDIYRCKGVGLPLSFKENAWSEAEVTAQALFDSEKNGVYKLRIVTP